MATRSTDVAMLSQCPGRWVLQNLYEADQAEASFFILGTQLHESIEVSINLDLDEDWALQHLNAGMDRELERLSNVSRIIESSSRGIDTMREDGERMLKQWFKTVHPDSSKRLEIYDGYLWPPSTEVAFMRQPEGLAYPVWGSIDALFRGAGVHEVAFVDWKSGASRQRNSDQLHFYMYGLNRREEDRAWFHHLDKKQKRSIIQEAEPYPGDAAIRQRILATEAIKDGIVAGEYPQFNPDWYCRYCPVSDVCPADGDHRNRDANAVALRRMLKLVRPITALPEVA